MALLVRRGVGITQTSLAPVVAISLLLPLLSSRISFWGHAGGVVAGFAVAWLISVVAGRSGVRDDVTTSAAVGFGVCGLLFVAALLGPTALGA